MYVQNVRRVWLGFTGRISRTKEMSLGKERRKRNTVVGSTCSVSKTSTGTKEKGSEKVGQIVV